MFYEYANRKAIDIVNLRRDWFGEIVEIVTDNDTVNPSGDDDDEEEYDHEYDSDDLSESEHEGSDAEMADAAEI